MMKIQMKYASSLVLQVPHLVSYKSKICVIFNYIEIEPPLPPNPPPHLTLLPVLTDCSVYSCDLYSFILIVDAVPMYFFCLTIYIYRSLDVAFRYSNWSSCDGGFLCGL